MKRLAILGSTGSIGESTLKVAKHLGFPVTALAAHSNITRLAEQIHEFSPQIVAVFDRQKAAELRTQFPNLTILEGQEGMEEVVQQESIDYVVMAIVGLAALAPTIAAIDAGKTIGLANKEVLISAGELISGRARKRGVELIPIDSEHSAIFQCLQKVGNAELHRIILTASGGPFRSHTLDQLACVTLEDALAHPTWDMGAKITIDSSTMMNKGFEVIEAKWLFDLPVSKIDVVVHPQSIIHSMIECIDGTLFAQMHPPDMVYPIQYALTHPERKAGMYPQFDFTKHGRLDFAAPDRQKFPSLDLAYAALEEGKSLACYLNAANEILVERFLQGRIQWREIVQKLETLLSRHNPVETTSLETVCAIDAQARKEATSA